MNIDPLRWTLLALIVGATASCRTATAVQKTEIIQPGVPGAASQVISTAQATDLSGVQHTDADVEFMQGMIHHHLQAIDMTGLLKANTQSDDMKKLGLRMELSQADEILMMRQWLQVRGKDAPGDHAHHMPGAKPMPGMLTAEEMEKLAAARGADFDRLFLEGMIKHHAGALTMVKDLFAIPGAGQESGIFAFASDVEADQRMEIERMAAMLNAMMTKESKK